MCFEHLNIKYLMLKPYIPCRVSLKHLKTAKIISTNIQPETLIWPADDFSLKYLQYMLDNCKIMQPLTS